MSTPRFTPGELTGPQAAALNELARVSEQFSRLTVAPPLSLTRPGGIPAIRLSIDPGMDLFLVEITGHSGTPPVHTGKRKTRDTSNNVIDLSPEVDYTQILNPLETAWDDGTLIAIFPIPEYDDWWWGIPIESGSSPLPPGAACEPHGWLSDRAALISMATATPKKVLTYEIFDGNGRCSCLHEQGRDPSAVPYPYTAFYDAGKDLWVGSVLVNTCCGCARLEIDILEYNGDTTDDWPPIKATLYFIGDACDETATVSYPLNFQCATRECVEFAGAGPKVCIGDPPYPCDNSFLVKICCADCDMTQGKCDAACSESCAPPLYKIDTTGLFTGADAAYSGIWFLPYVGNCTWQIVCGTVTITLVLSHTGDYNGDSTIAVTFGGAATYHLTALGQHLSCFNNGVAITLNRDTGDPALTPATIDVVPIYCEPCAPFECQDFSHSLKVSASSDDIPCIDGWEHDLTWSNYTTDPACGGSQWISDNFDPPCTTDTGFGMVCCTIVANDQQVLGADWNGCALSLVDVTDSPLSITWSFTGTCGAYTGTIIFVVTEQP